MADATSPRSPATARRLAQLTLALWVVLVVTGVYLVFWYRPTASAAYADMESLRNDVTLGLWVRRIHNVASILAIVAPVALATIHFDRGHLRAGLAVVAGLVTTGALWFSGKLLPWDQLALWSVTVGTNIMGYDPIFGDNVRFVLMDGNEVELSTVRAWFLIHSAALPVVLILIGAGYWFVTSRASRGTKPASF